MMFLYINDMRKTLLLATSLIALLVPVAQAGTPTRASVRIVDIGDTSKYTPSRVTIRKGGTVTWTWSHTHLHNVYGPGLNSGMVKSSGRWVHQFTQAGTYNYFCSAHSYMKGVVIVR